MANITWSCAITSGSGVCTNPGPATGNINTTVDLTAGSVATFTATAPILSNATGVIDNTAAVAPPAGTVDSNVSNNTALDNNTVLAPGGDIVITKDDGISSVVAGTTTTYTITVQNNGPSDMVGATVTDTFDPNDVNVPNVDWTCAIDGGSTGACGAVSGSGDISTSLSLTAGSSATFTAIVPVLETAVSPLINNAILTTPATFNNTNAANSTATDNNAISSAQADLEITKITSNGAPGFGEDFTYTVTLFNNGASGATNVVVTDTFPGANFNFVSAALQQGAGADRTFTNNGASLTWNIPFLPSGNSATIDITANITAAGIQTNSAEVTSSDQDDPDSTPANGVLTEDDMDSVDVNVGGQIVLADLQITKTDTSTTAVPGSPVIYSIVVSNDAGSPNDVVGAVVEDLFDPAIFDVPNVSWTCTITSGSGVCGSTGPVLGDINTTVDLNVGSAATFTVTAPVLANASGTVSNTATVTAPTGVTETNPGNNSAVDNNTVLGPVADLSITNVVDNPTPNIGDLVTFNIEVTNNGPSDATNVTVRDILPSGYAFDLAGTSATQGSYDNASGDWTVGTLSTSAPTQTLSLAATVMGTGDYVTVAQVWTSDAPDPDSTPANDLATEDDYQEASITTILESDLSIISVVDNLTPVPGQNVTFTLTVNNAGPSIATSVIVEDRLPTGFTYVSSSISSSNGDETASPCVHVNGVVTCELNSVDIGVDDVIELVAFSNPTTEGTTQTNVVEIVSATELDSDSVHGNNILSEDDQQSIDISVSTADQANLTLTKTVDDPEPLPFQNIEYTVVISNAGPADATNVEIVDTLPAGLDFVSVVVSGGDATEFCALAGQALTCDMGTVTVASPETVTITAAAQSGQEGNTLTNSVEVTEVDNSDPNSVKNNGVTTEDDYAEVDITVTAPVPVVDGIIEGYVFEDNGASAIPHDGQIEGSEAPFAGSEVQVYATTGALVASAVTDATGRYSLTLPLPPPPDPDCDYSAAALSDGYGFNHTTGQSCPPIDRAEYRILVAPPNNTIGISEFFSVSPADTGTIVPGTPANALIDFVHTATETNSYEINFGFIRPPTWQSDGTAEGSAGDKIYHAHQFTAQSDGDIAFTYTNVTANPASTAFSSTLFEDVNCNGALDAGDNPITGTVIDADVNPTVCVLDEVTIPANASAGDTYTATIQASIFYADTIGSNHAVSHTEEVTNVTDVVVAHEVFGFVFEDNGNSATAHDGSFDGLEPPTGGVTVQLFNSSAGTLIDSTITNADGSYSILVPDGVESELRVVAVSKEGYQWISEAFSNTEGVVGLATPGIPIDGEVSFTHNAGFANQYQVNFGQIKNAEWTGDRLTENRPGTSVLHAHKLRAHSAAVLIFEYSEQTANPPNTGFTAGLFEDINCNGVLDPEDSTIDPSIVGDIEVEASNGNSEICVINRVFIPTNASNDQTHTSIVAATLIYSDEGSTGHGFRETLLVTDVTRVLAPGNGVLQLSKTVQNVTESGAESTRNEASPDDILRYTIDFENSGTGPVTEVLIVDTTPAFTQLEQAVECPASLPAGVISCDVIEPSVVDNVSGYEGTVQWQFNGSLPSGAGGSVQYDIRIQ